MYKELEESVHSCLADKEHTRGEGGELEYGGDSEGYN